jgi:hypothetical protein
MYELWNRCWKWYMKTKKEAYPRSPSSHAVGCGGFAGFALEARWRKLGFKEATIGRMATLLVILRMQMSRRCCVRLRVPSVMSVIEVTSRYAMVGLRRTVGDFLLELAFEERRSVYACAARVRHVVVKKKQMERRDRSDQVGYRESSRIV